MAITDDIRELLNAQKPDTQTLITQEQPQQPSWVQNLIASHAASQTGGRTKRVPVGFDFKRDPFDPSSYYNQLGTLRDISRAATEVVKTEAANREAARQRADQEALRGALSGINPQYTYDPGTGSSRHYHLKGIAKDVAAAADYWGSKYGIRTIYGLGPGSVPGSDHPKGLALDYMINNLKHGHNIGDSLANDLIRGYKQWNVKYLIWNRYIWSPSRGWRRYHGPSDHTDHVHVSFNS